MITSVFLSNNIIQVAQGERSKNQRHVKKVYRWEMPEGCLLNGMITNEVTLREELEKMWDAYHLPATGVELVINSLAFSRRKLEFPTMEAKKLAAMIPMEYEELDVGELPVYDYMPYEYNPRGKIKVLMTVRATASQIETWQSMFQNMEIALDSITISDATILKYLKEVESLKQGIHMVLGLDDNSLNMMLWVDGQQKYTETKRLFSEQGTAEFGVEVARRISELQQFYRSLKLDEPLISGYTYGFNEICLTVLRDSLQDAGMNNVDILPLKEEYADELAAVGALINWSKQINLLLAYRGVVKKAGKGERSYKWMLVPGILLGIGVLITAVMGGISIYKNSQIKNLESFVQDPSNLAITAQADADQEKINSMQKTIDQADQVRVMIASYPRMNSTVANAVIAATASGVEPSISTYDAENGDLTVDVRASQVTDCNAYATALQATGLFDAVNYSGYSFDQTENAYQVQIHCILNENAGK